MITKGWNWEYMDDKYWKNPAIEMPYLYERWNKIGQKDLLDLGAGLGRHSIFFAKREFTVSAIDISEYGINKVNEWAKCEHVPIQCKVGNMISLPYKDNSFDFIIAYNSIYHCTSEGFQKTLQEIKRILRPNGEIFLTLLSKNNEAYLHAKEKLDDNSILRNESPSEQNVPHFYVNIEDIKNLFSDYSFEIPLAETLEFLDMAVNNSSRHWRLLLKKRALDETSTVQSILA